MQIAKAIGAVVTAVCGTSNAALVKSLGADEVIDYTRDDFTKISTSFDVVFDSVGKTSKSACKALLKPNEKYVSVTGSPKEGINDLLHLKEPIESKKIKSVIDRNYPLEQIREAHAYVESFRKKGNVTVSVV